MAFFSEAEPARGVAEDIIPGVRRLLAPNPGPMTYHGTNTYLIDHPDGLIVLDPGPVSAEHTQAILAATGGQVGKILLTHSHHDHLGGLAALREATGASTFSYRHVAVPSFVPDFGLDDGDVVAGLSAIFTPGHAADHVCYAMAGGVLFSGDHVMGWSTSVVGPPGGNMRDYFASLTRLLDRDDSLYLPGHGPGVTNPQDYARHLLGHRMAREAAVLRALQPGPLGPRAIMEQLYAKLSPDLQRAAERSVVAHLEKLESEGRVTSEGGVFRLA
jgi:glyoxylase-like metal-dependent hydrolase (beta-lactamase superfamily II)